MFRVGNAFYILLLIVSLAFIVTSLAYCLPMQYLPPWFQEHGWKLLLFEVGCILTTGLLSMGLDRSDTAKSEKR